MLKNCKGSLLLFLDYETLHYSHFLSDTRFSQCIPTNKFLDTMKIFDVISEVYFGVVSELFCDLHIQRSLISMIDTLQMSQTAPGCYRFECDYN